MAIPKLHEAARKYALAGIPVFPCNPGNKSPTTAHGFHDATTDLAQIDAWWQAMPDANVAFCPHTIGWSIVDADGPDGLAAYEALGAPQTYEVTTPRGGKHFYFEGELPQTAWTPRNPRCLGNHLDTRGVGSYALLPPSVVAGRPYVLSADRDLAPVPAEWQARLTVRAQQAVASVDALDLLGNVQRARTLLESYVEQGKVAVEFQGGDDTTYQVACEVLNLGLSPETATDIMAEVWYPHCVPNYRPEFIAEKVEHAARYAQNEPGAWGVAPASEVFAKAIETLPAEPEKRSRFHLEDEAEQDEGVEPSWLIKDLIQERSSVLLYGATQSFKSFLALDIALSTSMGVETFGSIPKAGIALYAALEGKTNIKKQRRRAWKIARGVMEPLTNFYVMTAPMVGMQEGQPFIDEIIKTLGTSKPSLIVLDTLSKCMAGLNENDAKDAGRFIQFVDSLVEIFECSVIAIHHTGKDESRGARGSAAFHAGFDTVLEVKAHRKHKAVEVWVNKHKDAEEPEIPWTFEGKAVGGSLVFFPTTAEEHRSLTHVEAEFSHKRVHAALVALGAKGQGNGVTTTVLAAHLIPQIENESDEARQAAQTKTARALGALSRGKLDGFGEMDGKGFKWFLPLPQ